MRRVENAHPRSRRSRAPPRVALVTGAIELLKAHVPVLSLGVLYVLRGPAGRGRSGGSASRCRVVGREHARVQLVLPAAASTRSRCTDSANWFALAVYLVTAVVVSELAARARRRAAAAEQRERESALLAELATRAARRERRSRRSSTRSRAAAGRARRRPRARSSSARRAGRGPGERAASARGGRPHGRDDLHARRAPSRTSPSARRFLPALAALLAVAVERDRLEREALEAEALRRSDLVKTALLRAVSHDLRSPLTAIRDRGRRAAQPDAARSTADDRDELLETIALEAGRLDRLVGDLLDLSRLEAGAAAPEPEVWALDDLVRQAVDALGARRAGRARRRRAAARRRRRGADPARAREPDRERAEVLAARTRRCTCAITATRKEAIVRVVDQGPGLPPRTSSSASSSRSTARQRRAALGRRPRPCDRARLRRGERRPGLGRVAGRAGRDVRARAAGRRGAGGAAARERAAHPRRRRRAADPARARDDAARRRATRSTPPRPPRRRSPPRPRIRPRR